MVTVVALAALGSACSGGGSPRARAGGGASTTSGPTASVPKDPTPTTAPVPVAASDPALGLALTVLGVHRATASTWVLRARLTNTTDARVTAPVNGYTQGYRSGGFSLVELVDPVGGRTARVLLTTAGECVCTTGSIVEARSSLDVFAAFPALPGEPTSVLVAVSGFDVTAPVPVTEVAPSSSLEGAPRTDPPDLTPPRFFDLQRRTESLDATQTTETAGPATTRGISSDVLFAFGSADLAPAATVVLSSIAGELLDRAVGAVTVVGHTDSVGSDGDNQVLSERRARSVLAILQPGVTGAGLTFTAEGRGEREPVAEESGPGRDEAAARNRRVTITYQRRASPSAGAPTSTTTARPVVTGPARRLVGSSAGTFDVTVDSLRPFAPDLLEGTFTVTNTGPAPVRLAVLLSEKLVSKAYPVGVFSGVSLVDRRTGTRAFVVADTGGTCLCTGLLNASPLAPGESRRLVALFPAPDPATTAVDVRVPGFAADLQGVPIG